MSQFEPSTYGDRISAVYDAFYEGLDTDAAVEFLAPLAQSGRTLELGIGTGRIALPLLERGVVVQGIDASHEMIARLRDKADGDKIPVTIGDFADVNVDGVFSLIYVVFNTFFGLVDQQEQVRCFQNVADRLEAGGVFVIEAFVPDLSRFKNGQNVECTKHEDDQVVLTAARHDRVKQQVTAQHIAITEAGINLYPIKIRYAWPSELDLMAQMAGLRLRQRWGGWCREPFRESSPLHVSVYENTV